MLFPAATLFQEGTSFTVGNIRTNINFLSVNAASVLFDFQESNVTTKGGFFLDGVRTTATDVLPNFASSSTYARFRNNLGIKNTYVGGQWSLTTPAATALSGVAVGTPLKVAGTTTYVDLQWFTQSTDNAFVYDGDQTIEVEVKATLSFSGTNGDQIQVYVYKWDDSASSYVELSEGPPVTMNAAGRAENITIFGYGELDNNDRIEMFVENNTAARDVTLLADSQTSVTERPS